MNKIKRKIYSGLMLAGLVAASLGAADVLGKKAERQGTLPVSLITDEDEKPVIIIDAGHGGFDGGCTNADGTIAEKGINLSILLRLRDMLEVSGYEVHVTRDKDISIHDKGVEGLSAQKSSDMDNRLELFNKYDNAICVSIHQNQFTQPQYNGAQMFYSAANDESESLARSIQGSFVKFLQPNNQREIKQCGKELFLCYYSKNPTVMVECGFLSNPEEAALLNTEDYQGKVAFTIFSGITDFINRKSK